MARNSLGRMIPETLAGKRLLPYCDPWSLRPAGERAGRALRRVNPGGKKLLANLDEAIAAAGLKDGMTISTHHALRNGDYLLNRVMQTIDSLGIRDIKIASSSIHPVHAELIPYIRKGVITGLECGVNGLIGELISKGELDCPVTVRSHGGRARSLISGEVAVDVAFIAAPCCDECGNMNGISGPSACGSLGYAMVDALHARTVVAVTDNLVPYPVTPISIPQTLVDYVVAVDRLGDPAKIVSTTTRITTDPIGLLIAKYAAMVIEASLSRPAAAGFPWPWPTKSVHSCARGISGEASVAAASPATLWRCWRRGSSRPSSMCSALISGRWNPWGGTGTTWRSARTCTPTRSTQARL
jgi:citrate lyase subunit alpha/citrate CoA-transferase